MNKVTRLLRESLQNPNAEFREGQQDAIRAVIEPPHRALVVQATGWGKSIVYFIATRLLRDRGRGPTLVVSPLLSLMRDQLRAAERLGIKSRQYTSGNRDDWAEIEESLRADEVDLLLISPERLANDGFRTLVSSTSLSKVGLIVIDEAHCISDWGHDFRPDYQRIGELIRNLPPTTAVLATTATANDRVVEDIKRQIGRDIKVLRGSLARKSLRLQVIAQKGMAQRLAWLSEHLSELPNSGIIYALTQDDAERVAQWLQKQGYPVVAYHAGLSAEAKIALEDRLLKNEVKALVATVALGMGFDKPDLGFVVHFQSPGNLVAYYQQIGRAGRAISEAIAILFVGSEDERIHEWFVNNARPPEQDVRAVLEALDEEAMSSTKLKQKLNMTQGEIEKTLKALSVLSPSPIVKVDRAYQRTLVPYIHDAEREAALTNRRQEERRRFVDFATTKECLMMVVQTELDDPAAAPCERCYNCLGREIIRSDVSEEVVMSALTFLRRGEFPIIPRKQWVSGALPTYGFTGRIGEAQRCEEGVCLSRWGEAVVGAWVQEDTAAGSYREAILEAALEALGRLRLSPPLRWVCSVPSQSHPTLAPDFAKRLAKALHIEYVEALEKIKVNEPQKMQRNSVHQSHNLDGAFAIRETRAGAVLLVDDAVDSGWTFTIAGALLREATSCPVIPFALCSTRRKDDDD